MSNVRFTYLRDKNRNPHSCLAVRVERDRGVVSYQLMTCHSADVFRKNIARLGAKERLLSKPITIEVPGLALASSHEISKAVMQHIASAKPSAEQPESAGANIFAAIKGIFSLPETQSKSDRHNVPKRARESAKTWLKNNCVVF
jgi:hypothetical protein